MIAQLQTDAEQQADDDDLHDDVRLQEQRDQRDVATGRRERDCGNALLA